jgi:hypothetical protein
MTEVFSCLNYRVFVGGAGHNPCRRLFRSRNEYLRRHHPNLDSWVCCRSHSVAVASPSMTVAEPLARVGGKPPQRQTSPLFPSEKLLAAAALQVSHCPLPSSPRRPFPGEATATEWSNREALFLPALRHTETVHERGLSRLWNGGLAFGLRSPCRSFPAAVPFGNPRPPN